MPLILRRRLLSLPALLALALSPPALAQEPAPSAPIAEDVTPVAVVAPPPAPILVAPSPAAPPAVAAEPSPFQVAVAGRGTAQHFTSFAIDPGGARSNDAQQRSSRISLRAEFDSGRRLGEWGVHAAVAQDQYSGTFEGAPTLAGDKLPGSRWNAQVVTQAWAGLSLKDLATLRAGIMSNQWGLGLIANDGNHALDSRRDDWFVLPVTGDRVERVQLLLQPFGKSDSQLRGLFIAASRDNVIEDAIAVRSQGDVASQYLLAARYHLSRERWAGLYYLQRTQTFRSETGPFLRGHVIDAAFDLDWRTDQQGLRLQGEALVILGRTNLAPSPDHPEHDVRQAAAVVKARWQAGELGLRGELDAGWFSGDDNLDDSAVTAFKANRNFQQGMILFEQVLGWQSGRARLTASNLNVVGVPNQDLDRLATDGAVTSAITVFPKVGYKLSSLLELYAGALLALSPTPLVDPFTARTQGGGTPRNYLGKKPDGAYLGTELDFGAAATVSPQDWPVSLVLRGECAVLLPGGVLTGLDNDAPILGGRVTLALLPAATVSKERK